MVLQCSERFYSKVSSGFLQQDSEGSYSFGKIQNVGDQELSEEKFSISLEKNFMFRFHRNFSTSFVFYFLVPDTSSRTNAMVSFNIETVNSSANLPL